MKKRSKHTSKVLKAFVNGLIFALILLCAVMEARAQGYSDDYINQTKWFNSEVMDLEETPGVLTFIIAFFLIIFCVVMAELMQITALKVIVGICVFFYSIYLYTIFSALFGIMFILGSISYILYGVFAR